MVFATSLKHDMTWHDMTPRCPGDGEGKGRYQGVPRGARNLTSRRGVSGHWTQRLARTAFTTVPDTIPYVGRRGYVSTAEIVAWIIPRSKKGINLQTQPLSKTFPQLPRTKIEHFFQKNGRKIHATVELDFEGMGSVSYRYNTPPLSLQPGRALCWVKPAVILDSRKKNIQSNLMRKHCHIWGSQTR